MRLPWHRAKAFDVDSLPWDDFAAAMRPAILGLVDDATSGAVAVALARGLSVDPEAIATAIASVLSGYVDSWTAEVIRTSQERIAAALEDYTSGVIEIDEFLDRADKVFDPDRATMFSVTENTRLWSVVNQVIAKDAGVEKYRFLTVRDPWVDEECADLDNQVFTEDELDESNTPPVHVNCRCMLALEVPEAQSREPVAA